jgi:membrane peptidoglycan carboxypeptidase
VLGTASPTVTQMAGAFSTFAAEGVHHQVHFVDSVTDSDDQVVHEAEKKGDEAFDQAVAAETSYALRNVVTGGSGSYANNLGRPAAGKTGTSQNAYSAWFAGYTPNLSTAVSIFREDEAGNPIKIGPYGGRGEITGGSFPTMVWTDYMSGALEAMDLPVEDFPERGELPQVEKPNNDSGVPDQRPAPAPAPPRDNGGGGGGDSSDEDESRENDEPEDDAPEEDEGDDSESGDNGDNDSGSGDEGGEEGGPIEPPGGDDEGGDGGGGGSDDGGDNDQPAPEPGRTSN